MSHSTSCRDTQNLHYLDSWNKHCGGGWWEFATRTLTLGDSIFLAYVGGNLSRAAKFTGLSLGATLVAKSGNDMYEAWTGQGGIARQTMGDPAYDLASYALLGYGLFKQVPKIGYLGNPKKDFFTRDPMSYEFAFKQYSRVELFHLVSSEIVTGYNNIEKYQGDPRIQDAWLKHIAGCRINAD